MKIIFACRKRWWSQTILWLIKDSSFMFSTNCSPLILKPLSTSAWLWDNTKMILQTFHKLKKFTLACIKLLKKRSLSWSNEKNFSLSVTTTELMNLRYSCFAWSASAALRRFNSYKLWISLLALAMIWSVLLIICDGDRHTAFLTIWYFNGHLSLILAINFKTMAM